MDGIELQRIRKMLGWSQEITAAFLGISKPYLSRMESGVKPLNKKALDFILLYDKGKTHATLQTPQKRAKKDNKKLLKIKPLTPKFSADFSQFGQVTDFSKSEWEKWWWRDYNPLCEQCKNECKQSIQAEIIICPQMEK